VEYVPWVPAPWAPPGWLAGGFGPDEPVGMMFWRRPGMARIAANATNTAPAVASTGRIHPSPRRNRSGTLDFAAATVAVTIGRTDFRAGTAVVLRNSRTDCRAGTAVVLRNSGTDCRAGTAVVLRNSGTDCRAGTAVVLRNSRTVFKASTTDLSTGSTARTSGMRALMSVAMDISQPTRKPRLSVAGSRAILLRIRSRPSPDGTTPSAAACNARRRRSPYAASGSVMTPAPAPYGARTYHAPCDSSLPPY
jgi:hypothetical protein